MPSVAFTFLADLPSDPPDTPGTRSFSHLKWVMDWRSSAPACASSRRSTSERRISSSLRSARYWAALMCRLCEAVWNRCSGAE
ncbi:hypothetical protein DM47_2161 [Burkholderia mallei]|nr:hypothetical protein DM75_3024 [Burkholderia mallei]KOS75886.1 hypothetical protein DM46_1570 [Burkholderia mallei]KOS96710.1 hypothetical protein DM49_2900 [Burkholderia mallei]KOT16722.1 hypothetical protein DM47_2161 [Burkholderia mallei]